jgi:hypothetical protein
MTTVQAVGAVHPRKAAGERLQQVGGAGAILLGAGGIVTWVAFLLSVKAFGHQPMVIGKVGQSYDYLQATLPFLLPAALVMSAISLVGLQFVRAVEERLRSNWPTFSPIVSLYGYVGLVTYQVMLLGLFFIEFRIPAGSGRQAIEGLIPGFFVVYSVAGLVTALFLGVWIFLVNWMARKGSELPRVLRYLGFLAAVVLVIGEFVEFGPDHPVEVFLVGTSLLTGIWLIWAGAVISRSRV